MKRLPIVAALVATALFPLSAFAGDCANVRNIDMALDLAGAKAVRFEVNAHDLEVRAAQAAGATLEGRACASSESALESLRVTQARRGDTLVVRLESEGNNSWNLFGTRYARLDVTATLPRGMAVQVDVGSGDAVVNGVASLKSSVGSGDLQASDIPGRVSLSVGSGDVQLEDIGALRVDSIGSGDVTAARVKGDASVGSIGSGDFDLYGAGGDVEVGSVGSGDAGMRNVAGSVRVGSVGSGDIEATGVRGDLVVRGVGSGNIEHRGVGGRVDLPADD
ncbi:MAG TPA: DUF4097 family beta strand repeat-containing protein [Xanthomonadaceae bacterium]|nr:DUF4097 family beta strand repeat-containing protein [Xanthomonadaceae bacterium]